MILFKVKIKYFTLRHEFFFFIVGISLISLSLNKHLKFAFFFVTFVCYSNKKREILIHIEREREIDPV